MIQLNLSDKEIENKMNPLEANRKIIEALEYLPHGSESEQLINWLYTPDPHLSDYLNELKEFLETEHTSTIEKQQTGYLLEKILAISFKGLAGYSEIKSYRSSSHQLDLFISGDGSEWDIICDRIYIKHQGCRGIVVEAKAVGSSVSSAQFSRLCSIMSLELCDTVGLGVFFTVEGAAGFPKRGGRKVLGVRDARLCQLLFHAKTGKKIIVLDKDDIFELDRNGALIRILIRKVKELD
jgi:hypothetical protein